MAARGAPPQLQSAFVAGDGRTKLLFADNSLLVLSASRRTFVHVAPDGTCTRQLASCALRRFAPALEMALAFTNLHVDAPTYPPCLRQQLFPDSLFSLRYPIVDLVWPADPEEALDQGLVEFLDAGRVAVRSRCCSGRVVLDARGLRFAVCYPLLLEHDAVEHSYTYVWQTQVFSAAQHPPRWGPPLQLVRAVAADRDAGFPLQPPSPGAPAGAPPSSLALAPAASPARAAAASGGSAGRAAVTQLPACMRAGDAARGGGGAADACGDGDLQREVLPEGGWWYEPSTLPPLEEVVVMEWTPAATYVWVQATGQVEVWLHADDSCMVSVQEGRFMQHFIPGEEDPRLYAAGAVPDAVTSMASGQRLEVGAVAAHAFKLRSAMVAASAAAAAPARPASSGAASALTALSGHGGSVFTVAGGCVAPYAPLDEAASLDNEVLEQQTVPGVGRFVAYADGRVKATFADRTVLNMDARRASCRLLLPDGTRSRVAVANPVGAEQYVRTALEFAAWGFKTPAERATALRVQAAIQAELRANARMELLCEWGAGGKVPDAVAASCAPPPLDVLPCAGAPLLLAAGPCCSDDSGGDAIPAYLDPGAAAESPQRPAKQLCAGADALGFEAAAQEQLEFLDEGLLLNPGLREQLVRSLLSRNAQMLQRLE